MNKQQWLQCLEPNHYTDKFNMLELVKCTRKRRLIAVAACRQVLYLTNDKQLHHVVGVAEKYADGDIKPSVLSAANMSVENRDRRGMTNVDVSVMIAVCAASSDRVRPDIAIEHSICSYYHDALARSKPRQEAEALVRMGRKQMAELIREIVNPFSFKRFPVLQLGEDARRIATHAYVQRDYRGLPILADALEEEGCQDAELLSHLRGPNLHKRGCWALDHILGM